MTPSPEMIEAFLKVLFRRTAGADFHNTTTYGKTQTGADWREDVAAALTSALSEAWRPIESAPTPDHPNALPLELLPPGWWIFTVRELHKNKDEDLQVALEQLSSAFAANYMVILTNGTAHNHDRLRKQATGMGKSPNEAFRAAIEKIARRSQPLPPPPEEEKQ